MSVIGNQHTPDDDMAEFLESFIVETNEIFERLDTDLMTLEKMPADSELHNTIFRAVHTVKGTSSFLGVEQLTELAHHFEDVLNKIRHNELTVTSGSMDVMFEAFDVMKTLLYRIKERNPERIDLSGILEKLKSVARQSQTTAGTTNQGASVVISEPPEQEEVVPAPSAFDPEMAELLESFIVEAIEIFDALGKDLLELEKSPSDKELHNTIFRAVHTVKGTSSFLGFNQLTELAHDFEFVLNRVRRNELLVAPDNIDVIFEAFDTMKLLLQNIESKNIEGVDLSEIRKKLDNVVQGGMINKSSTQAEKIVATKKQCEPKEEETKDPTLKESRAGVLSPLEHLKATESTIRVEVSRLDSLMNLVGELVLARNQLAQVTQQISAVDESAKIIRALNDTNSQVDFITTELQMAVMRTRMVPIGKVFNKLPRLIRDLAKETGKEIELQLYGEETDLDKTIIEELNDPLVHILRNAADHGIESSDARQRAGKPTKGTVIVRAEHEGNNIVISIEDDGSGMDPEILKQRALEKGLITEVEARDMSRNEAFNIIFAPGFSTAINVTNVSGRGVGMDVVRTNITKLKGIIEIHSEVGVGTKLILKLPLTLAIIQGLLAQVGNDVYAIPLESVVEVVRIRQQDITTINSREVIRMRDSVVPLARIAEIFDVQTTERKSEWMYVVVVGVAERRLGMVVDSLIGQKEIVVKSLGPYLGDVPGVAGSTILGDGRAIIIIDIRQFMKLCTERVNESSA